MSTISIEVLAKPPSIDDNTFERIRVSFETNASKSLKTDPDSFISKYESEVKEPQEFWEERQRNQSATHVVAVRGDSESRADPSITLLKHDWVAFLVVIAPEENQAEMLARESSEKTALASSVMGGEYFMAAVYVDPSVRGQGVAKRLVQAMFNVIREDKQKNNKRWLGASPVFDMGIIPRCGYISNWVSSSRTKIELKKKKE